MRQIVIIIGFLSMLCVAQAQRINPEAWKATTVQKAIEKLYGKRRIVHDSRVIVDVPKVASNGGAVPIHIKTLIDAKSVAVFQDINPAALVALYRITHYSVPDYTFKIRLASSGTITIVVEGKDGKLYANSRRIEVALGGCEGDSPYSPSYGSAPARHANTPSSTPIALRSESYSHISANRFKEVVLSPLSTFSTDVDTASYTNIRRYLFDNKQLPPKDAVRIEEMINYFSYAYKEPTDKTPFAVSTRIGKALWNKKSFVMQIGIQTKNPDIRTLSPSNLVFLIDVSGSMRDANKLPLLVKSLSSLVKQLRKEDKVSIVTYAGDATLVLDRANGNDKQRIIVVLSKLHAGGRTAGENGIRLAYDIAEKAFIKKGNNRIVLATDGDFNIGIRSLNELSTLIEEKRKNGIYLSVLGFGMGNYKDDTLELLADKGNGNYAYIDNILEAKKVLVQQMSGTLYTVAKDVKIQVEFNPYKVKSYRLIGYENRLLENEDFKDDKIDAAEVGTGHRVTALYEVVMRDRNETVVSTLKYQTSRFMPSDEIATVKIRYKSPESNQSVEINKAVRYENREINDDDFAFVQSVAGFDMLLRDSKYKNGLDYRTVIENAKKHKGEDKEGYRAECIKMMERAELYCTMVR